MRFYRVEADGTLTQLQDVEVGYLPDSIAFNAIGTKLVIANEGEPISGYATDSTKDPVGSIGIIDIAGRVNLRFSYTDLGFAGVTLPDGIRISGPAGTTQATDIEPEYVSVLGNYAYVTLQENNGVAKVNLISNTIEKIFALGAVDYSTQLVDLTDRDNSSGTTGFFKPLLGQAYEGLRMADGIAAYSVRGKDFFVTANEGDGRDGYPWAPYTDEARGSGNANRIKRLTDDAAVGSADRITTFGSRSISIFDAESGALLWDSGNSLQTIAVAAGMYADSRSDDKGVEPEGIVVAQLNGRSYAIASLERTTSSMLVVFDVTDPSAGQFVTSTVINGSVSPEGLHIVEAKQSPTGRAQLVVSNEVSNTLNVFDLEALIAAPPVAGAGTFASTMLKDVGGGPQLQISSLITNGEFTNGLNPGDSVFAPVGIFDGMGAYDNGKRHLQPAGQCGDRPRQGIRLQRGGAESGGGWGPHQQVHHRQGQRRRRQQRFPVETAGWRPRLRRGDQPRGRLCHRSDESLLLRQSDPGRRLQRPRLCRHDLPDGGRKCSRQPLFCPRSQRRQALPRAGLWFRRLGISHRCGYRQRQHRGGDAVRRCQRTALPVGGRLPDAAAQRTLAFTQGAMQFTRVEDGDVSPLTGQQVVFNSTGGSGADLYGSTYVVDLAAAFDANGLLASGLTTSLKVLVDTDKLTGLDRQHGIRSQDNLAWGSDNFIYIQEDKSLSSGTADGQFGSQEASIWKVDPVTGLANRWAQIDRSATPMAYGQTDAAPLDIGNWESSGIIDVSAIYGAAAGAYFLANVQAHSITNGNIGGSGYLAESGQIDLIQQML